MSTPLVVLEYEDLLSDKDLSEEILRAYGAGSLGALGVRGIPNWVGMCQQTLPLAHQLVSLPAEKLSALEDENSLYNAGWSYGKEKMGDVPDFAKGSFYFNPLTDNQYPEMRAQFPAACPPNKWPDEADIPSFKENCRELGAVMRNVAVQLARHIDNVLVKHIPGYVAGHFHHEMEASHKAKARMLYYYPIDPTKQTKTQSDNWIAWHNDSGFLTCLASEIFVDHTTGKIVENPEPDNAGLFIADR